MTRSDGDVLAGRRPSRGWKLHRSFHASSMVDNESTRLRARTETLPWMGSLHGPCARVCEGMRGVGWT